jgi:hypothetical protein
MRLPSPRPHHNIFFLLICAPFLTRLKSVLESGTENGFLVPISQKILV